MGRQQLSKQLKEFIREQIHSVVLLEVLLLLHRNQPRSFRAVETATELGIEEEVAKEQLYALVAIELITQSEGDEPLYWYHPSDPGLSTLVNELALAYSKQRIPVLSLILTKRPDRIMGCLTAAVFFLRFCRRSRDRFVGFLGPAFVLLAINWLVLVIIGEPNRFNPAAYLTRLTAFVVIIVAVVDKNRPFRSY